jgi:hypothetical protein
MLNDSAFGGVLAFTMAIRSVAKSGAAALAGLVALGIGATGASAQDPFEIQVYEYVTVPRGTWNLETHFNHVQRGTRVFEGLVAPTEHQTHLTFELTRGITDWFELAGYLVTARRDGDAPEYVAWRVRPRVRAPESWKLPVGLSLSTEVAFPKDEYEESDATLEVRPIIEWGRGRFLLDLNPVIGRALKGPGSGEGWDFEPGVRLGWTATKRLDLSLEYYGSTGLLTDPLPGKEQVHQFFPGGDWQINENVVFNFGVGFGATNAGNRLVYKTRLGWLF